MNLTRNFSLLELTKSDTAIRKGIDNNPNADQIEKLKALCENILQPVRDHFGLENVLETGLVTLGSVTFWSQNGLETGLRPFWSQKWSRDLVSSLSGVQSQKMGQNRPKFRVLYAKKYTVLKKVHYCQ